MSILNKAELITGGFNSAANDWSDAKGIHIIDISAFPGFVGDGEHSDVAAIEAAIASFNINQSADRETGNGVAYLTAPPGSIIGIDRSISIPYNLSVDLRGAKIIPLPGTAGSMSAFYGGKYIFCLNSNVTTGNQIVNFSGNQLPEFRNAIVDNTKGAVNACLFWSKSKHSIDRVHALRLYQFYVKTGSGNYEYTDLLKFSNINLGKFDDSTDYAIDIGYHGDGLRFEGVHLYRGTTTQNKRLLKLDRCQGGIMTGCINGDIYIKRCQAISIHSNHTEFGIFDFESSNVSLRDSTIWVHPEAVTAGYVVRVSRNAADKPSGSVILENIDFRYLNNRHGLTQASGLTDFTDVQVNLDADVDIRKCYRRFDSSIDPSLSTKTAIKVGVIGTAGPNASWESRATDYTRDCSIRGGLFKSKFSSISVATLSAPTMNSGSTHAGIWNEATATYTYRFQYLFGPKERRTGLTGATTFEVTNTNGGGCPRFTWLRTSSINPGYSNMTVRVYRSIAGVDQYNAYTDIAVASIPDFYDTGFMLSTGERWIARTAGVVDNVNLSINEINMWDTTVTYRGTLIPSVGDMVTGDRFINTDTFEEWVRDQTNTRWVPVAPRPQITSNPATGNVGSTVGHYVAYYDAAIAANRVLTLSTGSKIPGMIRELVRLSTCTGAFTVSLTDGTTTWSLAESGSNQKLKLICDSSLNWKVFY